MITTPEITWLAILPELLLAFGAAAVLLVEVQWKPRSRVLGAVAAVVLMLVSAATVVQWIEFREQFQALQAGTGDLSRFTAFSDMIFFDGYAVFGRILLLVVTILGLAAAWELIKSLGRRGAEAIALIFLATAGFSIMVASNNLILMFLGLEVGSIALYVLAGLNTERKGSDEAALKYFLMGSFASAILVYGVALLYAGTGQFELLSIREFFLAVVAPGVNLIMIAIGLIVVGLGFKVTAVPFHSWAPDVYQGAPAGVVGYMAAAAKVAGFVVLTRIMVTGLIEFSDSWVPLLDVIAALSMVFGALAALVQTDIRRMLAYSGVAHAGFIMTGVTGLETSGVLFYLGVYAFQLVAAFALVSAISGPQASGSPLTAYRGLGQRKPALAAGFTVLLLGMAGIPLTSGFIAKFGVLSDAWSNGQEWLVFVAVLASVIALAFYLRVVVTMYMEDSDGELVSVPRTVAWVVGIAVVATILFGIAPGLLLDMAANALPL